MLAATIIIKAGMIEINSVSPLECPFTVGTLPGLKEIKKNEEYSYDSGSLKNRPGDSFFLKPFLAS
jgi:hypothetical protein